MNALYIAALVLGALAGVLVALVFWHRRKSRELPVEVVAFNVGVEPAWTDPRAVALRQRGYSAVSERLETQRLIGRDHTPEQLSWMWDCVETAMCAVVPNAVDRDRHLERTGASTELDTSDLLHDTVTKESQ